MDWATFDFGRWCRRYALSFDHSTHLYANFPHHYASPLTTILLIFTPPPLTINTPPALTMTMNTPWFGRSMDTNVRVVDENAVGSRDKLDAGSPLDHTTHHTPPSLAHTTHHPP